MQKKGNTMLRHTVLLAVCGLAAAQAHAAEAGRVIFVAGAAQLDGRPAVLGAAVAEGELISTAGDGYLYIKTVDNGLFILRPSTRARIAAYHVDAANPANTRIKLELLSGVARSQSGEAVKLARQNFRFNTPVAAIGVRGTDFTVFTDQDTSRVTVISGGVTVSGFAGACRPEGSGPCEGAASRELSAAQKGQLLQIQRGQGAAQLLPGGALAPDAQVPPRADEPLGKGGSALNQNEPSLDPRKNASLQQQNGNGGANVPLAPQVAPPVIETVAPPPPPPAPVRQLSWGRWAEVAGKAPTATLEKAGFDRVAANEAYVLFRSSNGGDAVQPERGSVGFSLLGGEAAVRDTQTQRMSAAKVENGRLLVDFGKASFASSFDVVHEAQRYAMSTDGTLTKSGLISSYNQFTPANNMTVNGYVNGEAGASYLFQGNLTERKIVSGVTVWGK